MDVIPESVLSERVLAMLNGQELARAALVSRTWRAAARAEEPWRTNCAALWRGKARMPFSFTGAPERPFHLIRLTPAAIQALSVKDLRILLRARREDYTKYIEKAELRRAFIETSPGSVQGLDMEMENKWIASYAYSLRDARRTDISTEELVESTWIMFFRQSGHRSEFKFLADHSVKSAIAQGLNDSARWHFAGYSPRVVQVDSYPPLSVSRRADWGWCLQNEHVVMLSEHYGSDASKIFARDFAVPNSSAG